MSLGCCKVSTPLNGVMVNEAAAQLPTHIWHSSPHPIKVQDSERTEHKLLVDIISAGSEHLSNSQVGCILQAFIGKIQVNFSQVLYLFCFLSYVFPNLEKGAKIFW